MTRRMFGELCTCTDDCIAPCDGMVTAHADVPSASAMSTRVSTLFRSLCASACAADLPIGERHAR